MPIRKGDDGRVWWGSAERQFARKLFHYLDQGASCGTGYFSARYYCQELGISLTFALEVFLKANPHNWQEFQAALSSAY